MAKAKRTGGKKASEPTAAKDLGALAEEKGLSRPPERTHGDRQRVTRRQTSQPPGPATAPGQPVHEGAETSRARARAKASGLAFPAPTEGPGIERTASTSERSGGRTQPQTARRSAPRVGGK